MGRLFWKFFLCILLAQVAATIGVGGVFWLRDQARQRATPVLDSGPPAAIALDAAAATLRHGGLPALRSLLPEGTQLLAPDLPGFGSEPAPAGFDYSVDSYADWVAAYSRAHQLGEYVLVGHSMGGKIALALAARQPTGLRGLVLLSPSPPSPEPISDKDRAASLAAWRPRSVSSRGASSTAPCSNGSSCWSGSRCAPSRRSSGSAGCRRNRHRFPISRSGRGSTDSRVTS